MLIFVFLATFAVVCLVLFASTADRAKQRKLVLGRIDALRVKAAAHTDTAPPSVVRREEAFSAVPWLDRLLRRLDLTERLRLLLYQAELPWTVGRLVLTALLVAFVTGLLVRWRTGAAVPGLLLGVVCGLLVFYYVYNKRERRFEKIRALLPEALDLMVAAIRAGHSLMSAIGQAARESPEPLRRELRQCFEEQNFGLDLRTSMENLAYRVPIQDIRVVSTAVLIQKEAGGNLTEILEKVAIIIREEYKLHRQVRVHTAQGRMTGWILSLLPVGLGVMMYIMNPKHMSLLWTRPLGVKMLSGAIVMTLIGGLLIRKIINVKI